MCWWRNWMLSSALDQTFRRRGYHWRHEIWHPWRKWRGRWRQDWQTARNYYCKLWNHCTLNMRIHTRQMRRWLLNLLSIGCRWRRRRHRSGPWWNCRGSRSCRCCWCWCCTNGRNLFRDCGTTCGTCAAAFKPGSKAVEVKNVATRKTLRRRHFFAANDTLFRWTELLKQGNNKMNIMLEELWENVVQPRAMHRGISLQVP